MDLVTLAAFTIAYAIAVLVPGPGVAAVVARALGGGFKLRLPDGARHSRGRSRLSSSSQLFGLAAIATWFGPVFTVVKWVGAALPPLYRVANSGAPVPAPSRSKRQDRGCRWKTFLSGFALTMGNPKTIVFYLAMLPTVIPLDKPITALGFAELTGIVVVVLLAIGCAYAGLAAAARDFFKSSKALRILNRTAGVIMASAAAFVVVRE
jgi:threonine/homoserine/homoserine lactone efflux protein